MEKLDEAIISALRNSSEGLPLAELAEKLGLPEKKVFRELRKLFERGTVDSKNRRYRVSKE